MRLRDDCTYFMFGGVETYAEHVLGARIPHFCAFQLQEDAAVWQALETSFFLPSARVVLEQGHGLLTNALTWRASPDYLQRLGYAPAELAAINGRCVDRCRAFRAQLPEAWQARVVLHAEVGPRGDGYSTTKLSAAGARAYHRPQLSALAAAGTELVSALTLTSVAEAVGIAAVCAELDLPVVIAATLDAQGRLLDGHSLDALVAEVDAVAPPVGFMVNCAHPTTFVRALQQVRDPHTTARLIGFRPNASAKSHAELDNADVLDRGDPHALARSVAELHRTLDLRIVGGCCGTDAEHLTLMARALAISHERAFD